MDDIQYRYTQKLREGIFGALANLFIAKRTKKDMAKIAKLAKNDPELQAAIASMKTMDDTFEDIIRNLCKRRPNHPECVKRKNQKWRRKR